MTEQANLFEPASGIQKALESPIAANADPDTSHEAARKITDSGKREGQLMGVLALVKRYPLCTSMELAIRSRTYDRYILARRLPELASGGLVLRRTPRQCTVSGLRAITWEAAT